MKDNYQPYSRLKDLILVVLFLKGLNFQNQPLIISFMTCNTVQSRSCYWFSSGHELPAPFFFKKWSNIWPRDVLKGMQSHSVRVYFRWSLPFGRVLIWRLHHASSFLIRRFVLSSQFHQLLISHINHHQLVYSRQCRIALKGFAVASHKEHCVQQTFGSCILDLRSLQRMLDQMLLAPFSAERKRNATIILKKLFLVAWKAAVF